MKTLFLIALTCLVACTAIDPLPNQTAILRSMNTFESVRLKSSKKANSENDFALLARNNPTGCECPRFEIYAYGEWIRTPFTGKKEVLNAVQRYTKSDLKTIKIRGRFSGKNRTSPNGVLYESFELIEFDY